MTLISDLTAPWFASASECGCGHVAVNLFATARLDPKACAEPLDDWEVVVFGDDWRECCRSAASQLAQRIGRPVSAVCSSVIHDVPGGPDLKEFSDFMYAECDTRTPR